MNIYFISIAENNSEYSCQDELVLHDFNLQYSNIVAMVTDSELPGNMLL
jgi:hypothetical protein